LASVTLCLIVAGALVTSNDAGLAVPDWPTSFGSLYRIPPMVGGVKFEHGHRMLAEFVGLLTIILAVWTARVERRSWIRKLGWIALALVITQGILGGITVRFFLPPWVSTAHATLAQTFFCLTVAFALFTSRRWIEYPGGSFVDRGHPSVRTLTLLAASAVYMQLILGAAFRHSGLKLLPHLLSAVIVTVLVIWTVTRVLSGFSALAELRRPAQALLGVLLVQLALGFAAYLTRVAWSGHEPQPQLNMVVSTVAHVAVGAVMLATTMVLALEARHVSAPQSRNNVIEFRSARKAVTA
jgi:heme a synthase